MYEWHLRGNSLHHDMTEHLLQRVISRKDQFLDLFGRLYGWSGTLLEVVYSLVGKRMEKLIQLVGYL
jgi:hypothetical protein